MWQIFCNREYEDLKGIFLVNLNQKLTKRCHRFKVFFVVLHKNIDRISIVVSLFSPTLNLFFYVSFFLYWSSNVCFPSQGWHDWGVVEAIGESRFGCRHALYDCHLVIQLLGFRVSMLSSLFLLICTYSVTIISWCWLSLLIDVFMLHAGSVSDTDELCEQHPGDGEHRPVWYFKVSCPSLSFISFIYL